MSKNPIHGYHVSPEINVAANLLLKQIERLALSEAKLLTENKDLKEEKAKLEAKLWGEKKCYEAKRKLASQLADDWASADDKIKALQSQLDKVKRISNSCVPCSAIDGDCCGVIYWTDDGKFLCNECGREFNIDRWIPVTEAQDEDN